MKTHICLVSAQAAANMLPALDPALRPEKVILVVSTKMQKQSENLAKVLREVGVTLELAPLTDEHNYTLTEGQLLDLASRCNGEDVALNITGGTKLISLAAQSVATTAGWRMFYVDADTDRVSWLHKGAQAPQALTEHLRLRHYLLGYGYDLPGAPKGLSITPARQQLMDTLIRQIGSLETPLAQLNWLAQQAEDKQQLSVEMTEHQRDSRSLDALLRHFEDASALKVQGNCVAFAHAVDRDFVKGGWLEGYVFRSISRLKETLSVRDMAANLLVVNDDDVKNELDIAFMAHNRLFITECKTARLDKPEAPKANDTLFKLAEISRRIGGLGTRSMLASYRSLRESEKRLAKALNIELVCGPDLIRLDEKLKHWVNGQ